MLAVPLTSCLLSKVTIHVSQLLIQSFALLDFALPSPTPPNLQYAHLAYRKILHVSEQCRMTVTVQIPLDVLSSEAH
jgi:hypothetical protein